MLEYNLTLFAHVLVVVYLFGADLGRFYLVRIGQGAELGLEARRLVSRGVLWIGSATNLALILILPAGVSVGSAMGAYKILHSGYLVGTWVVAAVWALVAILADRVASRKLQITDLVLRFILAPGFIYDGVVVFTGSSGTVDAHWLATKLILYGLLILLSIPVRRIGFELRAAMSADDAQVIHRSLEKLQLPILAGWAVILAAAWFGVAKPF